MAPKRRGEELPSAIPSSPSSFLSSSWYSQYCNDRFFSSLRQVEDRLASESDNSSGHQTTHPASSSSQSPQQQKQPASSPSTSSEKSSQPSLSYSAPLFIEPHRGRLAQPHLARGGTADPLPLDSSDPPPLELFSSSTLPESPPSSPGESSPPRPTREDATGDLEDDLERLMELLGLSAFYQGAAGGGDGDDDAGGAHGWMSSGGHQDVGFLSKIAGVKGPKCRREVERLDGWIRYYLSRHPSSGGGGGKVKKEPARLAHLLLARVASGACDGGDGSDYLGGIGFPETVEEYLQHDPPAHFSPPS